MKFKKKRQVFIDSHTFSDSFPLSLSFSAHNKYFDLNNQTGALVWPVCNNLVEFGGASKAFAQTETERERERTSKQQQQQQQRQKRTEKQFETKRKTKKIRRKAYARDVC